MLNIKIRIIMKLIFFEKFRSHKLVRFAKIVAESASFALLVSIVLFAIQMYDNMQESKELSQNLLNIRNSLSTKYLGKFPDFMPDINRLYGNATAGDSIVVLEDVLFYGINSAPKDFYESSLKLFDLAANGSPVMISYYKPGGMVYSYMLQEMLLSQRNYIDYRDTLRLFYQRTIEYRKNKKLVIDSCVSQNMSRIEIDNHLVKLIDKYYSDLFDKSLLDKHKEIMLTVNQENQNVDGNLISRQSDYEKVQEYLLERYFARTREEDPNGFRDMVAKYRRPTMLNNINENPTRIQIETHMMCLKMDSVRQKYLGFNNEPVENIKYSDFSQMFTEMTLIMEDTYHRYPSITLVPVDEFISIRSWLVNSSNGESKAIMAFPSRYSSSEIGFYTTDETTRDYIKTMQNGILINYFNK